MKLSVDLEMNMDFVHVTGKEIKVNKTITETWDENSEKFQELVKAYEELSGKKRSENASVFDQEMLTYAAKESESNLSESVKHIQNTFRDYCLGMADHGYIEYGGCIINIRDISAIRFNETKVRIRKG